MINVVGIIGGGIMGSGIAEVAARSGLDVVLREVNEAAVEGAQARLAASLDKAVRNGKLGAGERNDIIKRVRFTDTLDDLSECDLVAEAAIEDEDTKTAIFAALGKVVRPDALLTSNTSSIPIMKLAAVTPSPERVVGMHFFNPATVLPLVEVIPCELASDETVQRVQEFARDRLGKTIILAKDRAGFVVNALLIPYLLAAIRMVDAGLASAQDIDTAMVAGCAHPMGPLALTDLIGLDTAAAVAVSMYEETKEQLYETPPLLLAKGEAGDPAARPGGDSSPTTNSPAAGPTQ